MRDTKLIKSSLFVLNIYFFGLGVSVEENSDTQFESNITGMESFRPNTGQKTGQKSAKISHNLAHKCLKSIKSTKMEQSCKYWLPGLK